MGKYINYIDGEHIGTSFQDKCSALERAGALEIDPNDGYVDNMVCVVDNGHFAAAAYAYRESEYIAFKNPMDNRPKKWYQYEYAERFAEW